MNLTLDPQPEKDLEAASQPRAIRRLDERFHALPPILHADLISAIPCVSEGEARAHSIP